MLGWLVLVTLLGTLAGALWARGRGFYVLDLGARVDHPDYRILSPGYIAGHGYGIVGTGLILFNLLYLLRRLFVKWRLGSMRAWLNLHAATGLFAGVLVLFHSAFQLRTPLATITMVSVAVLIVTGIIGRFIFAFTPSPDLERLEAHLRALDSIGPGMGQAIRRGLEDAPQTVVRGRLNLIKALLHLGSWRSEAKMRRRIVLDTAAGYAQTQQSEVELLRARITDAADIAASVPNAAAASALMGSWRGFHRFTALLALLLVGVHIAVAWYFGYRWIFSDDPTLTM